VRESSRVPAIALTAFARSEDSDRALAVGFAAYLSKPAEPAAIVATCVRVLDDAAASR
jgi:CheY-like chemotaxis protein